MGRIARCCAANWRPLEVRAEGSTEVLSCAMSGEIDEIGRSRRSICERGERPELVKGGRSPCEGYAALIRHSVDAAHDYGNVMLTPHSGQRKEPACMRPCGPFRVWLSADVLGQSCRLGPRDLSGL